MEFLDPTSPKLNERWDAVVIGSGFGALFFLKKYLENRPRDKVLIIEKGGHNTHDWQLANLENSNINNADTFVHGGRTHKPWSFTIGLGGSTNCWWGLTPRLHPSDFGIRTRTGVNIDWPISYDDLVPFYNEAEQIMLIAGPDDLDPYYPGTGDYPQPAHRFTSADELMRSVEGHRHFAMPQAKLTRATATRNQCCATGRCNLCPVNAKFTALNDMQGVLSHPNVSIILEAEAQFIETAGGAAKSVTFRHGDRDHKASTDLCILGANAIHSPFIMLRSGIGGHGVGRYLGEKMLAKVEVLLDGLDHYNGGTSTTGFNITLLEEGRKADRGMAMIIFDNRFSHGMRLEPGRWLQSIPVSLYIDDIFDYENGVFDDGGDKPVVKFKGFSKYCERGLEYALSRLPDILSPLPVEAINFSQIWPTLGHVQGSLRMGPSIDDSVVDHALVSHAVRNLVVVGTSVFPTSGSANPTLTAAALSLRSADHLTGSRAS